MPNKETISIRILKLLNLESEFEMSYEEYSRHLKEALVAARLQKSKFSSEEAEILLVEFKRVRGKTGRFTINVKKEPKKPVGNISGAKKKNAIKFLTGTKVSEENKKEENKKEENKPKSLSILEKISKNVDNIYKGLLNLQKIIQSSQKKDRIKTQRRRRAKRESALEKGKSFLGGLKSFGEGALKPIKSIWQRIIDFLVFTFLGRLFKMFTDFANNPANKKKLDTVIRFLTDFSPAIAGAALLFLTPFGKFIRKITSIAAKLTFRLARFAIPKLIGFIMKNPLKAAAIFSAGKLFLDSKGAGEEAIKEKEKELGRKLTKEEETQAVQDKFVSNPILGPLGNLMVPILTQQATADDKPEDEKNLGDKALDIGGGLFDGINQFLPDFSGIFTGEFNKGGVFSGLVDKSTGTPVSGFGKDTQFLPMSDGKSGVVVQPGEIVMNKEQQQRLAADTGVDPREYVPGPKKGKIQKFASGGMIGNNSRYQSAYKTIGANFPSAKPYHIAAALGNFETEAPGLKPNTYQLGGGPGRGIAQWETPGRWDTATRMYGDGIINSLSDQLSFMKWEMDTGHPDAQGRPNLPYGRATKRTWLNTTNLYDATIAFMKAYEAPGVPHLEKRQSNAKQFLDLSKKFETPKPTNTSTSSETKSPNKSPDIFKPFRDAYKNFETFRDSEEGVEIRDLIKNIMGLKGGGEVKENTGIDIPGATDDRQLVTMRVQPNEVIKVFTKDFVDRGGMKIVNHIQSRMDSDSNARKSGIQPLDIKRYIPESPSTSNGGIKVINLPTETITNSAQTPRQVPGSSEVIPNINAISPTSMDNRMSIAKIYGMMD